LRDKSPKESFFFWCERDRNKILSPCLFVTLTCERNIKTEDSWKEVGRDFNRWITRLRKKYGKIDVARVFEAHESGYCHVHAVLYFRNTIWKGFRWGEWVNGKRQITYRVDRVGELALCWFFRKRSFSFSGHLSELYGDLIKTA